MEQKKKITDPQVALAKAQAYCAYQERCQQEVRNKLYEWGLWTEAVEKIIANLITDNFLNEERFSKTYAGGKFRIKEWGKIKIVQELKRRNITPYCIKSAMKEIPDEEYRNTIQKIISEKAKQVKERNPLKRNYKIAQYLISRGFEADIVWDEINMNSQLNESL